MDYLKILLAVVTFSLLLYTLAFILTISLVNTDNVRIQQVKLTDDVIALEQLVSISSAGWYVGHTYKYDEGILTIKIYQHQFMKFPTDKYFDEVKISILNTYPDLREVRLAGGRNFEHKVIWSRE